MSLIDVQEAQESAATGAVEIRQNFAGAIRAAKAHLRRIRGIVQQYGRTAIVAELGDDAAALLTVYTKLKEAIEAAGEASVEDLPT